MKNLKNIFKKFESCCTVNVISNKFVNRDYHSLKKANMKSNFIFLKVTLCILGVIFIISCTVDLIYTTKEMLPRDTVRSLEINMGYQVIFLMGTMPVLVGTVFEAKEPMVHFLIMGPYSVIVDVVWLVFVGTDFVQFILIKKWWVVGFLIWKIVLSGCCTLFAGVLLRKIIRLKKWEEGEWDFEKTYAFRRFGTCLFYISTLVLQRVLNINIVLYMFMNIWDEKIYIRIFPLITF